MTQKTTPKLPHTGRALHTYDDLADEIDQHFLPGQYVHVERWTTAAQSAGVAYYTMIEGYVYEGYDWEFLTIGQIDRNDDQPSPKRLAIALTGDEGVIVPTVTATGTLVIPDPAAPRLTYRVTSRTPVFDGPTVDGCLTNDRGQESPFDVTKLKQAWIDIFDCEVARDGTVVERTVYRHEVHDGDGTLMGCIETADGGQTWQACKWYSFDEMFAAIDAFEPSASISDNAELVYREAGGTGRWTKCTMIEIPLFDMVA